MRFRTSCDERKPFKGIEFTEPSRTKQADLETSDINNILAKYATTGVIDYVQHGDPLYGDFSQVDDYQSSLNKVMSAQAKFDSLPSEIRKKFNYDPQAMVSFVLDKNNLEECVKLGLLQKPVDFVQKPVDVPSGSNIPASADTVVPSGDTLQVNN